MAAAGDDYHSRGQSGDSEGGGQLPGVQPVESRGREWSQLDQMHTPRTLPEGECVHQDFLGCSSLRRSKQIRPCARAALLLPCKKGLGLLFAPQLEAGCHPCLSRKLLSAGGRSTKGPCGGTSEATCSGILL